MRRFDINSSIMDFLLWLFISGLFISIVILEIAAGIYILVFLLLILQQRKTLQKPMDYLFLLFVFSGALSSVLSGNYNILMLMIPLSFIPISAQLNSKRSFDLDRWINWIILFATVTAVTGIIYHYLGRERTTGFYGGYFILATLMSWAIPLTIAVFMSGRGVRKYLYILSSVLQVMALWWTATRSAMLGLFAGFGVWFVADLTKNSFGKLRQLQPDILKWFVSSIPLLLLFFLILFSNDPRMNPTVKVSPEQESSIDITSGRAELISEAVKIIKSDWTNGNFLKILFGYGPYSCQRMVGKPYSSWESDYLHSLMEQGLLGLILVIFIYYFMIKYIIRGLLVKNYLINSLAVAGIITFLMSFFTLRITGWHSVAVFIIIYNFLARSLADVELNQAVNP